MKRTIALFVIALIALNANAKIWRVNNSPFRTADYIALQDAIEASAAGDTIYVEGSSIVYGEPVFISKKLHIIGPGYFLSDNPETQAYKLSATFGGYIYIQDAAIGTVLEGLVFNSYVYCGADNVIFRRNMFSYLYLGEFNNGVSHKYVNVKNVVIESNFGNYIYANSGTAIYSTVSNNIVETISSNKNSNLTIINNTIKYSGTSVTCYNSTIANNLCRSTIAPTDGTNTLSNNISELGDAFILEFVANPLKTDKDYKLSTKATALGAGTEGTDCGAFGGVKPYVLSGLPVGPHIYELVSPATGSANSGLPVKIKVKSQN